MADAAGQRATRLWWARRGGQCVAAAMVLAKAGQMGTLFHCPASTEGIESEAVVTVVRAASYDALESGLSFVQSLQPSGQAAEVAVIASAGYELLAELIYMKLDLPAAPPGSRDELTWRYYGQFTEAELAEVIGSTYEGSLDCPALNGVRDAADIIAGHKAGGLFVPRAWWIVEHGDEPAGCVLVNDLLDSATAEVVYIGVVPAFRGKRLGRAMLRRAAAQAHARTRSSLRLAVDARNSYARRIYDSEGFRGTHRCLAYVMLRRDAEDPVK